MSELEIVWLAFSIVIGIAVIVTAFNVVAIRRILEGKRQRSDTTDPRSPRT